MNSKHIILILGFVVFCKNCFSYDMVDFYKKVSNTEYYHVVKRDYSKSARLYKELTAEYDSLFIVYPRSFLALEAYLSIQDSSSALQYCSLSFRYHNDTIIYIDNTYSQSENIKDLLFSFKNSALWKSRNQHMQSFISKPKMVSLRIKNICEELNYLNGYDQGAREMHRYHKNDSLLNNIDKNNFKTLIALLKNANTTDEQAIVINRGFIVISHNYFACEVGKKLDSTDYLFFTECLNNCLKSGSISNRLYAQIIDRSKARRCGNDCEAKQVYGTHIYYLVNSNTMQPAVSQIDNIELIDNKRESIGLPSLLVDAKYYNFELPKGYTLPH